MLITFKVYIISNSFWLCIYTLHSMKKGKKSSKNTLSEFVRINRMHNLWFHTNVSIYWVEWVCVERDAFVRAKWKKREENSQTPTTTEKPILKQFVSFVRKKQQKKKVNWFFKIKMCFLEEKKRIESTKTSSSHWNAMHVVWFGFVIHNQATTVGSLCAVIHTVSP